jgi:hypothetical protein
VVYSKTDDANHNFSGKYVDICKSYIHAVPDVDVIREQFEKQKKWIERLMTMNDERKAQGLKPYRLPRLLMVFDDCACDGALMKSDVFEEIAMNGRQYGVYVFFACQYLIKAPPAIRQNAHWVFACAEPSAQVRKKLYDNMFSVVGTYDQFQRLFLNTVAGHGALVINKTEFPSVSIRDNGTVVNDISNCVFSYHWPKLAEGKPFRIGGESQRQFHRERYNENWANADAKPVESNATKEKAQSQSKRAPSSKKRRGGGDDDDDVNFVLHDSVPPQYAAPKSTAPQAQQSMQHKQQQQSMQQYDGNMYQYEQSYGDQSNQSFGDQSNQLYGGQSFGDQSNQLYGDHDPYSGGDPAMYYNGAQYGEYDDELEDDDDDDDLDDMEEDDD